MTEDEYRRDVSAKGDAEPTHKIWTPDQFNDWHRHEQALYLLVQTGELSLDVEDDSGVATMTIGPGETIEVPARARHSERAGGDGVAFLVASR